MLYEAALAEGYFNQGKYKAIQPMIAIAEAQIEGVPWRPAIIADKFIAVSKRDPRGSVLVPKDRNGPEAAMRAVVCGLHPDLDKARATAVIQAKMTHDEEGVRAAEVAAAFSWYFHNTVRPKCELPIFISKLFSNAVVEIGAQCVWNAMGAVVLSRSQREVLNGLELCQPYSLASCIIAMAASAPCHELKRDIPAEYYDQMEAGEYGRSYISELDKKLISPDKVELLPEQWRLAPVRPEFLQKNDYGAKDDKAVLR